MRVKDILKHKGPHVFTIGEENNLLQCINILANNNIGSLLVLNEHGKISGIISERDIIRQFSKLAQSMDVKVKDVMTQEVIIVEPEDEMEYVDRIMTDNHLRHLPVVDNRRLVGMLSIGDSIKYQLGEAQVENKYLRDYISGNVPKQ
jgi:CBS domain-containing protein